MKKDAREWLDKLIKNTGLKIKKKFTAGDLEHESKFLEMTEEQLMDEAMDEMLDLVTYISRLKELIDLKK